MLYILYDDGWMMPGYGTTKQTISSINLDSCQQSHVADNDDDRSSDYFALSDAFYKANFGDERARQARLAEGSRREFFSYSYYGTTKNHIDVLLANDESGTTSEGIETLLLLKRKKQPALTTTQNNTLAPQSFTSLSAIANYMTSNENGGNGLGVHHIKIVGNKVIMFKYNKKIPYRGLRNLPDEKMTVDLSKLSNS
jgi:hypothetical protein